MALKSCKYGGGPSCTRQGGDGSLSHATKHVHKYTSAKELGEPLSSVLPVEKSITTESHFAYLEDQFDPDLHDAVLSVQIDEPVSSVGIVKKSLYDFDLETEDGITRLLALLPILDQDIVREVYAEIWPGYPPGDVDPKRHRLEVKGYLLDYLEAGHVQGNDAAGTADGTVAEEQDEEERDDSAGSGEVGDTQGQD